MLPFLDFQSACHPRKGRVSEHDGWGPVTKFVQIKMKDRWGMVNHLGVFRVLLIYSLLFFWMSKLPCSNAGKIMSKMFFCEMSAPQNAVVMQDIPVTIVLLNYRTVNSVKPRWNPIRSICWCLNYTLFLQIPQFSFKFIHVPFFPASFWCVFPV